MSELGEERQVPVPSKRIALRGYTLATDDIKTILEKIQRAVQDQGKANVDLVQRPADVSEQEWDIQKTQFVQRAWKATTTVVGHDDDSVFAPSIDQVFTETTPQRIAVVYSTNRTAFQSQTGNEPPHLFELNFDFTSPPIPDGTNPISAPTPNQSYLMVRGGTATWVSSVEAAVFDVLKHHRNGRGFLHGAFVYEWMLLLFGLPFALGCIYLLSQWFAQFFGSVDGFIAAAIYVYLFVLFLFIFRIAFGYLRFLFPIVELTGKYNRSQKHRKALGWLVGGLLLTGLGSYFFP